MPGKKIAVAEAQQVKIETKVLPKLFKAIKEAADREDVSPGRWIALHLAEHFELPVDESVPKLGRPGRPRNKALAS